MAHRNPHGPPPPFANIGHRHFQYGAPQGDPMPPMFPPGLPCAPYMPQFLHPGPHLHPQPPPMHMMPNPYGQLQAYGVAVNPAHVANPQPPPDALQIPVPGPPGRPQPPPALRNCPNREIRPGVFAFQLDVLDGEKRETFDADTEMPWVEVRDRITRALGDPQNIQLAGKIVGEGKWGVLNGPEGFQGMMQRICQKASNARTKPVSLEVKNTATPPPSSNKPKSKGKRSRKEDVPPAVGSDDENNAQYLAYKQLAEETRCEAHHGHCHITQKGSSDDHHRLSHQEMTLWAKKMSLNEATKYAPPHCLNFDSRPTLKSGRRSASTASILEVHVTIQNISPDGSSLASSAGHSVVSSSSSAIPSSSSAIPQHHVTIPPSHPSPSTPPPLHQPPSTPSTSVPSTSAMPIPSSVDSSALSWGTPVPAIQGQNVFPPLSTVMALLASEPQGQHWNQLEVFLREAGVYSSEHILLADPTVLALVGNMGTRQATMLRNCAKRVVLPVLGLNGTYQEDENKEDNPTDAPPTRKRPLDLGESVVHSLYKKPKLRPAEQVAPKPNPLSDDAQFDVSVDDLNSEFDNETVEEDEDEEEEEEEWEDELDSEDDKYVGVYSEEL